MLPPKNGLIGKNITRFIHPDNQHYLFECINFCLERGENTPTTREKLLRLDGSEFVADVSGKILMHEKKISMKLVFQDVSEAKRSTEALENSEDLFRQVWENSRDGMRLVNTDGIILRANNAYCEMMGKSEDEIVGKLYTSVYGVQEQPELFTKFRQRITTRSIVTYYEKKLHLWDGRVLWLELSNSYVDNTDKNNPFLLSIIRDITPRKTSEEQLLHRLEQIQIIAYLSEAVNSVKNLEEIYDVALHALKKSIKADMSSILLFDSEGVMQFVDSVGLSKEYQLHAAGHSPWKQSQQNVYPLLVSDVTNEPSLTELLPALQQEGIHALGFIPLVYQDRLIGKFMVYFKERHEFTDDEIQLSLTIARHVAYAIGQKQSKLALQKSESNFLKSYELLKSILESPKGMIIFSLDTEYNYLAYTKSHKTTMKNIWGKEIKIGMNMLDLIADTSVRAKAKINYDKALRGEQLLFIEELDNETNTRTFWENRYSPIITENNSIIGLTVFVSDVTERKTAEEQIRNALREKEALLKEIHHRVKNNMQIISSLLHLQAQFVPDKQLAEALVESQNRVKSMSLVHEQLYQTDMFYSVNIGEYMRQLSARLLGSIGKIQQGVLFEFLNDEQPVFVNLDTAIPLGLIVNELVTNSLKYAFSDRSHGKITISIHKIADTEYELSVQDDGIGIPDWLDITKAETLGLQIVQTLSEQLGGTFSHPASTEGSHFVVSFIPR
ncbi:MAG: PAS domain S-box protein [Ignavibacteria bacterium]|nr:PAS domain S-box protein [Ignavibacteria bacterium]